MYLLCVNIEEQSIRVPLKSTCYLYFWKLHTFFLPQSSVECVERGELLAELRERYSNLLNRIPRQVKR